jgi:hypothetical protein
VQTFKKEAAATNLGNVQETMILEAYTSLCKPVAIGEGSFVMCRFTTIVISLKTGI